jgi:hypothetical protein
MVASLSSAGDPIAATLAAALVVFASSSPTSPRLCGLTGELRNRDGDKRRRIAGQVAEVEQKIERQLAAIEAGVDPVEVGQRIRELKAERAEARSALAQIEDSRRDSTAVDPDDARAVLAALPDLGKRLAVADPTLRRAVFDAFRLHVEIDRNAGQVRLKALVSSAFGEARNLSDLGEAEIQLSPLRPYRYGDSNPGFRTENPAS